MKAFIILAVIGATAFGQSFDHSLVCNSAELQKILGCISENQTLEKTVDQTLKTYTGSDGLETPFKQISEQYLTSCGYSLVQSLQQISCSDVKNGVWDVIQYVSNNRADAVAKIGTDLEGGACHDFLTANSQSFVDLISAIESNMAEVQETCATK